MIDKLHAKVCEAISILNKGDNIFLASHINPDGDSLGSLLALAMALKTKGKSVYVLGSDETPRDYAFLPGIELIENYNENMGPINIFLALDSSDPDRLGHNKQYLNISKNIINIDHHISNTNFGHLNIVNPNSSATGELVYEFITEMGIEIDKSIATNLYTAISTDTGNFTYESVTSKTHRIVAGLIDTGINVSEINTKLYESISIERANLFTKALNRVKMYNENKLAIIQVTQEMLEETSTNWEDTEGIVSFIRKISSVEIACLLKQYKEKEIKVSMRSKRYADASLICGAFKGGGHKRAAGCTIYSDIDTAEKMIVAEIQNNIG